LREIGQEPWGTFTLSRRFRSRQVAGWLLAGHRRRSPGETDASQGLGQALPQTLLAAGQDPAAYLGNIAALWSLTVHPSRLQAAFRVSGVGPPLTAGKAGQTQSFT
jgi:hypothetical protein